MIERLMEGRWELADGNGDTGSDRLSCRHLQILSQVHLCMHSLCWEAFRLPIDGFSGYPRARNHRHLPLTLSVIMTQKDPISWHSPARCLPAKQWDKRVSPGFIFCIGGDPIPLAISFRFRACCITTFSQMWLAIFPPEVHEIGWSEKIPTI